MLASISLKDDDLESGVSATWSVIEWDVRKSAEHHQTLAELLATMARLPPARDDQGNQLKLYNSRIWDDLPTFGRDNYDHWQLLGYNPDDRSDGQAQKRLTTFLNVNNFAIELMRTQHPTFASYDFWCIVVIRETLERPRINRERNSPEALIPAAVAWISNLGPEIYSWDKEFPYGGRLGDRGRGGPLWNGQHGFCKERWNLWKRRFIELSFYPSDLSEELRVLAREGAAKMAEVEDSAVQT